MKVIEGRSFFRDPPKLGPPKILFFLRHLIQSNLKKQRRECLPESRRLVTIPEGVPYSKRHDGHDIKQTPF